MGFDQPLYCAVLTQAITEGRLNLSARRGCISLLPKKGKDTRYLKNWRPLTLLNIDYKILAKVLANRIKRVLNSIISENQYGFMEKRNIAVNIRKTMDIYDYCEQIDEEQSGYVVVIDYEKCFDKIEYGAIQGSLKYFNFGEKYSPYIIVQ